MRVCVCLLTISPIKVCESVRAVKRGDLQAFCVDKNCKEWNHLTAQSRGLVIDHERRTLVLWGASYEADLRATYVNGCCLRRDSG